MADEPSIPMDQEEEDNEEFFSARESLKRGSKEKGASTPTPTGRSTREASPGKQQAFFSDEAAQQGSDSTTNKSELVRRMLKDRTCWDMREYKKEELEAPVKPKKKKKKKAFNKTVAEEKKKKVKEVEEKSKTDEESEEKDETKEPPAGSSPTSDTGLEPRPFFQSEELILKCRKDKPIAPKCKFDKLRFSKAQEVVEYDAEGAQPLQPACNERAISNPWRRWGAHRALCDQGGYMVGKNKKIVEIKRGSDPPRCPPNPRQVTLNKNGELPDSQTMMGTIKVEVGPAGEEVHRIGKVMEEYVRNGGFVPPPMTKKEMAARPPKGQPVVVVQAKAGAPSKDASGTKGKRKKNSKGAPKKTATRSETEEQSGEQSAEDGDSMVEKKKDESKKRFGMFKRSKPQTPKKKGNKGQTASTR